MIYHKNDDNGERRLCWTEDNRLQAMSDRRNGAWYNYDATGERNLKLTGPTIHVNQNGMDYYSPILQSTTLYASPLITLRDGDYTKHYFEKGKRICSVIGNGGLIDITNHVEELGHPFEELRTMQEEGIGETFYQCIGLGVTKQLPDLYNTVELFSNTQVNPDEPSFYYTTDHLGSSSYLTNDLGQTTQIIAYMPYGEDWVNRNFTQNFRSNYKYNGKEKDPESGYYNYGARYYGGNLPIWLSVDPLSDKYPHLTPYAYCAGNPIMLVDPDGREIDVTESINKDGKREINIKFTANLINNTSKGYSDKEMENIAGKMSKSIEDFYKGQYGDDVSVNVNADIKPTLNSFTAENSRHIISIVDNDAIPSGAPANAENGGRLMKVTERVLSFGRAENVNSWRNTGLTFNGSQSFDRTIAHEFGHLCNLPDNNNMPSLMMQSGNREMYNPNKGANYRRINIDQLNSIIKSSNEGQLYKGRY
jgi:RHS repeat-associated protein